jgi:hypothetical protein
MLLFMSMRGHMIGCVIHVILMGVLGVYTMSQVRDNRVVFFALCLMFFPLFILSCGIGDLLDEAWARRSKKNGE